MNETSFDKAAREAAGFQKLCLENFTKALQSDFQVSPDATPPDILRQIRSGMFQALAQSWDEYMRSPQFLECMRQWMENAVAFRSMTNEFLGRVRNEAQAPSRSDIDTIMLAVRHMEKRLLDRLEDLSAQLPRSNGSVGAVPPRSRARPKRGKARPTVITSKATEAKQ